jgi:hypothetical protein
MVEDNIIMRKLYKIKNQKFKNINFTKSQNYLKN